MQEVVTRVPAQRRTPYVPPMQRDAKLADDLPLGTERRLVNVVDTMTLDEEQAHVDLFHTSDDDGRLYDLRTGALASNEDWRIWFDIRVKWRAHQQAVEDSRSGYDRRIGGGISWNRASRA